MYKQLKIYDRNILVSSFGHAYIERGKGKSWQKLIEFIDKRGYHRVQINHHYVRVHRLVAYAFGVSPTLEKQKGLDIDHINNNPEDNRLVNLQLISSSENRKKQHQHQLDKLPYQYVIYKRENLVKAVAVAPSLSIAAQYLGVDGSFVSQVVRGLKSNCRGYVVRKIPKKGETPKDGYRQMMDGILGSM